MSRPRRLPGLTASSNAEPSEPYYVAADQREQLYAKYGDLTRSGIVARHVADVANAHRLLPVLGGCLDGSLPARCARDDMSEYVTRREMEERLSQMDMRISLLATALAQQDELSQRMQTALDEVLAKTAALPPPRPARSALSGLIVDGVDGMLDAGGNAFPDPSGGGGGGPGGNDGGGGGLFPFGGGAPGPIGLVGLGGGGGGMHGGHHPDHHGMMGMDDQMGEDEGEEDDQLDGVEDDGDDEGEEGAPAGLEALAGMEAVGGAEVEVNRGVGEAGMVKVPGRGMKQVRLQLRYNNPIVIACLVPPRPSSALQSPEALRRFEADLPRSAGHAVIGIPFKSAASFTVQLLPPSGTDMMVAYVVMEAGTHVLEGGARLIAGEETVSRDGRARIVFEQYVRSDTSFDRVPSVVCTPQVSEHAGLLARCEDSSQSGFTIALAADPAAAAAAGRKGKDSKGGSGAAAPLPSQPPPPVQLMMTGEEASEEETRAATRLQARQRGRLVRSGLIAARAADESVASIGWLACDAVDALGVVSAVAPPQTLGDTYDIRFDQYGIDYPETPVLLYGLVGGGDARARCVSLDERGASVLCEGAADADADAAVAAAGGGESLALGWLALPPGRLFPVSESDSEDEADDDPALAHTG